MKNIILFLISAIPINFLRIVLLNKIFKYQIDKSTSIGYLTIINSKDCDIKNSQISSFNYINVSKINIKNSKINQFNIIKNFHLLEIFENCSIEKKNKFYGEKKLNKNSELRINNNCNIGNENFFDLSGDIELKRNCKILNYCQFWTHGFNSDRQISIGNIEIGENVRIESSVTIISNVKIIENCIIKISSVVTKSILEENIYSSNKLIKKE